MQSFQFGRKTAFNQYCFKLIYFISFTTITKQEMTAYTKLQIIHIGTDVHIRVQGTSRGKHPSKLLISLYFGLK